jgi:peptidoglycan/LPS O-acetylase OafA/YrhL
MFLCATGLAVFLIGREWPRTDSLWLGYINPVTGLCSFVLGVAAALYAMQSPAPSPTTLSKATTFEVAAFAMALAFNVGFRLLTPYHLDNASGFTNFSATSMAAPAYAALIFVLSRYHGALGCFLSTRVLVLLGESSFALYMFHQIIISWRDNHTKLLMTSHVDQFILFLGVVIPLSVACVERPGRLVILWVWRMARQVRPAADLRDRAI